MYHYHLNEKQIDCRSHPRENVDAPLCFKEHKVKFDIFKELSTKVSVTKVLRYKAVITEYLFFLASRIG